MGTAGIDLMHKYIEDMLYELAPAETKQNRAKIKYLNT